METHDWRGASFFSKSLQFGLDSNNGCFSFISPFPSTINFSPQLAFSVKIIKFMARESFNGIETRFDMDRLKDDSYYHPSITYQHTYNDVYLLHLFGPNDINIKQYGDIPFGACVSFPVK